MRSPVRSLEFLHFYLSPSLFVRGLLFMRIVIVNKIEHDQSLSFVVMMGLSLVGLLQALAHSRPPSPTSDTQCTPFCRTFVCGTFY
jgi:hypothetical protein